MPKFNIREFQQARQIEQKEIGPEPDAERAVIFQFFNNEVEAGNFVYYPFSGADTSPSIGFPDKQVIYAETDPNIVSALQKHGFTVENKSATEWTPDMPVDILVLINPGYRIPIDTPLSAVATNGYVICTDHHAVATRIHENKQFALEGIMTRTVAKDAETPEQEELCFDRDQPEQYFEMVDTDEELQHAVPHGRNVTWDKAKEIVQTIFGEETEIVRNYTMLLDQAKAALKEGEQELPYLPYTHKDKVFQLYPLPRKKGKQNDFFVFRRVEDIDSERSAS